MRDGREKTVAVTGGVASGKSFVAKRLHADLGGVFFDADAAVHGLLEKDGGVIEKIAEAFPRAMRDGKVCRRELRAAVFAEESKRRELEALLHPCVLDEMRKGASQARENRVFFIAEIPLLFEIGIQKEFGRVVLVASSPGVQLRRLQEMRGVSMEDGKRILEAQWGWERKVEGADFLLWNDGEMQLLEKQVAGVKTAFEDFLAE